MRNVLIGAVDSTRVAMEVLVQHKMPPSALCTLPKGKARRHSDFVDLVPLAQQHQIPVIETPDSNAPEFLEQIRALDPDYLWVIGWSQICRPELLQVPQKAALGFHPAALPQNRGRAVIPWTILQRATSTGATLFWLDEGVDSGDILAQQTFPVTTHETARSLYDKHLKALNQLLHQALPLLAENQAPRITQDHRQASWCAKRTPEDGLIDWNRSAEDIWTLIRAVGEPYPGAFTHDGDQALIIWEADLVGEAPYCGLPGQVQAITDNGVLVQCGDGRHVLLRTVELEHAAAQPAIEVLKIHRKLGMDTGRLQRQSIPHNQKHGGT